MLLRGRGPPPHPAPRTPLLSALPTRGPAPLSERSLTWGPGTPLLCALRTRGAPEAPRQAGSAPGSQSPAVLPAPPVFESGRPVHPAPHPFSRAPREPESPPAVPGVLLAPCSVLCTWASSHLLSWASPPPIPGTPGRPAPPAGKSQPVVLGPGPGQTLGRRGCRLLPARDEKPGFAPSGGRSSSVQGLQVCGDEDSAPFLQPPPRPRRGLQSGALVPSAECRGLVGNTGRPLGPERARGCPGLASQLGRVVSFEHLQPPGAAGYYFLSIRWQGGQVSLGMGGFLVPSELWGCTVTAEDGPATTPELCIRGKKILSACCQQEPLSFQKNGAPRRFLPVSCLTPRHL